MTPLFGINIIGYVSSNVNLGITARHFIKLFLGKGIPVLVYDIDYNRHAPDVRSSEFDSLTTKPGAELSYLINLFFLLMGQLPAMFLNPPPGIFLHHHFSEDAARKQVNTLFEELERMPRSWLVLQTRRMSSFIIQQTDRHLLWHLRCANFR